MMIDPRIRNVIIFKNGNVAVCNATGQQLIEHQGTIARDPTLLERLRLIAPPDAEWLGEPSFTRAFPLPDDTLGARQATRRLTRALELAAAHHWENPETSEVAELLPVLVDMIEACNVEIAYLRWHARKDSGQELARCVLRERDEAWTELATIREAAREEARVHDGARVRALGEVERLERVREQLIVERDEHKAARRTSADALGRLTSERDAANAYAAVAMKDRDEALAELAKLRADVPVPQDGQLADLIDRLDRITSVRSDGKYPRTAAGICEAVSKICARLIAAEDRLATLRGAIDQIFKGYP